METQSEHFESRTDKLKHIGHFEFLADNQAHFA